MKNAKPKTTLKSIFMYILMFTSFILMIIFSIQKRTPVIKVLPCLVTIVVQFLNSNANKYAKLIGAFNCILYSAGYFMDGLWGSFFNAILISSTVQFITFFRWNNNKYKQGTIYRKLSLKLKLPVYFLVACVSLVSIKIFQNLPNTNFPEVNGILFGVSLVAIMLIVFGVIDGMEINLINCLLSLGLYIYMVIFQHPENLHYIVISTYSLIGETMCYFTWRKLYKEQTAIRGKPLLDFEKTTL